VRLTPALLGLVLAFAGGSARAETELPPTPRPWLGIGFSDNNGTAWVTDVHPGTGAAAAGLLPDDVIVEVDGVMLSPGIGLPQVIGERKIGQRVVLTVLRRSPDGMGEPLRLVPRLSAMPSNDELVYRRLFDRVLPALTVYDRHGAAVPAADWTRRPQVWMLFDARCEACGGAASALRTRLLGSDDGAADAPLRTVLLGQHVELGAYMARVPLMGTVWRIDRGDEDRRNVMRYFLSGLEPLNDGVIVVVDHRGIVRFATAISAGEAAHDGACAAAARAMRAWRP
jgi:hypothetical protein